jgi:hypothetical protein
MSQITEEDFLIEKIKQIILEDGKN